MNTQSPIAHTPSRRQRWLRVGAAAGIGALALSALVAGTRCWRTIPRSAWPTATSRSTRREPRGRRPRTSIDWATSARDRHAETRKADLPTGTGDDSFGQGSKEDTRCRRSSTAASRRTRATCRTSASTSRTTAADDFLHLFWHRVQEPDRHDEHGLRVQPVRDDVGANGVTPCEPRATC